MSGTLADGQLTSSPGALFACPHPGTTVTMLAGVFVSSASARKPETVELYLCRHGGGTRRIARAVLAPGEQMHLRGLPVAPGDKLVGCATHDEQVDFVIFGGTGQFGVVVHDAAGIPKWRHVAAD